MEVVLGLLAAPAKSWSNFVHGSPCGYAVRGLGGDQTSLVPIRPCETMSGGRGLRSGTSPNGSPRDVLLQTLIVL